jgi:hypothetical protein
MIDFNGEKPQTPLYGSGIEECLTSRSRCSTMQHQQLPSWASEIKLAAVSDLVAYSAVDGGIVLEFVAWSATGHPIESFRITLCSEDAARIRAAHDDV